MSAKQKGKARKYGDNINTDIIAPPQYMELTVAEAAKYAMSAIDPEFATNLKPGDILVAGNNFGSGSSRETAPLTLKHLKVGAIVAKFFARIFYRNAINIGLPVVECSEVDKISDGDELEIDLQAGRVDNKTTGESYACSTLPPHIMELIDCGGLVPYLARQIKEDKIS